MSELKPHEHPVHLYQRVLENLNTAVLLLDHQLRLRYLNPAAEALLKLSARRITGLAFGDLLVGDDALLDSLTEALRSDHAFTKRELPLAVGTRTLTVDLTAIPLGFGGHEHAELLVELSQVDRQLRISREEHLLAQHTATRALVRGLAHEIKNPLGGLRGAAQLLERELGDQGLKEYTQIIIGEADRLQNLVDRMLGPNALPRKQEVNLHQVLERVRGLVASEAPPGVVLERDYDPSIPPVYADPDQLIQAVLNIVRNAVQAVGGTGRIVLRTRALRQFTIGTTRHKLVARVDVVDDGPGIPPDLLDNIFYPMVTGRPDGTGLGLSIAQALVSQHGGLIECESAPGRTVFSLFLPLGRVAQESA